MGWSETEVKALFAAKHGAPEPMWESTLALWRLGRLKDVCDGSKAWRVNVWAWLVRSQLDDMADEWLTGFPRRDTGWWLRSTMSNR